jgi:hypothetical protein
MVLFHLLSPLVLSMIVVKTLLSMFMMCVGDNAGSALLLRFVLCWNGQYTLDARGSITVPLHKWTLGGRLDALQV